MTDQMFQIFERLDHLSSPSYNFEENIDFDDDDYEEGEDESSFELDPLYFENGYDREFSFFLVLEMSPFLLKEILFFLPQMEMSIIINST